LDERELPLPGSAPDAALPPDLALPEVALPDMIVVLVGGVVVVVREKEADGVRRRIVRRRQRHVNTYTRLVAVQD
jgi:hypothetical protein